MLSSFQIVVDTLVWEVTCSILDSASLKSSTTRRLKTEIVLTDNPVWRGHAFVQGQLKLKAPFPYFGGKSKVAHLVWERLGDVHTFIEPFFGSGAVLLSGGHRSIGAAVKL